MKPPHLSLLAAASGLFLFPFAASAAVISQGATVTLLAGADGKVGEEIGKIVDGNTTKYYAQTAVLPSIRLVPTIGGGTIVTELRIFTGNDMPDRDPTGFILWGSNDGTTYVQIAAQALALPTARNASGITIGEPPAGTLNYATATFTNTVAYTSYRFDVTSTGGGQTQFSELQLIGTVIPEPTSAILFAFAGIGMMAVRRRSS